MYLRTANNTTMLTSIYTTSPGQGPEAFRIALLDDAIDLTHRLTDYLIQAAGDYTIALSLLDRYGVTHRLPEADAATTVELLADLRDIREELQAELEATNHKRGL